MDEISLGADDPVNIPALIRDGFGVSGTEARRLIVQEAVKLDGETLDSTEAPREELVGKVLKVGKRRFARLVD